MTDQEMELLELKATVKGCKETFLEIVKESKDEKQKAKYQSLLDFIENTLKL
jgi:hypothetical protein